LYIGGKGRGKDQLAEPLKITVGHNGPAKLIKEARRRWPRQASEEGQRHWMYREERKGIVRTALP